MRRHLTVALLEAEAMEPRLQLAYSRGLIPSELPAKMGLVRLLLERADLLTRDALDRAIADTSVYYNVYSETVFSDRGLVEGPLPHRAA
jgi:hypothetical protein